MSGIPAPGPPATSHLLGVLRSWLRTWSSEDWQSSEDLPRETEGPNAQPCASVRVLVVDDNPVNLMVISTLLEARGLVPVLAADGAEAVALACELHFDLILMDLQMPILDGWEATTAIRRFENACSRPPVPVVAYSSLSPGAAVLASRGMDGSLDKPCEDQALEDCLVQWCPSYNSTPTARGARDSDNCWQSANRNSGSGGASLLRPGA